MTENKIYLGKIVGAHGVKGLFKVEFYSNFLDLKTYKNKIYVDCVQFNLEKKFTKGKLTICKSENHNSKEKLKSLIGKELWTDEVNLIKDDKNEYFHKDLIGCKVYNKNNKLLGKVSAIHNFGAGDLLELDENYKYMIRLYDLNKDSIDIKSKIIKLSKNYEL